MNNDDLITELAGIRKGFKALAASVNELESYLDRELRRVRRVVDDMSIGYELESIEDRIAGLETRLFIETLGSRSKALREGGGA